MTDEDKANFERDLLLDVEDHLLRKRFNFVMDALKFQREDIETLFKYNRYTLIYATVINLILLGLIVCLILMS